MQRLCCDTLKIKSDGIYYLAMVYNLLCMEFYESPLAKFSSTVFIMKYRIQMFCYFKFKNIVISTQYHTDLSYFNCKRTKTNIKYLLGPLRCY